MGNAPSTQDPPSWGKRRHGADRAMSLNLSPTSGRGGLLAASQGPPLNRRASSFLDEPVEAKRTERGEDEIRLLPPGREGCDGRPYRSVASAYPGREPAPPGAGRLRYAASEMQGWRSHMEDQHVLSPPLSADPAAGRVNEVLEDHHLFAVFDGHGGEFASQYCGEHLSSVLQRQESWRAYLDLHRTGTGTSVQRLRHIKSALTSTFHSLDEGLRRAQQDRRVRQLRDLRHLLTSVGGEAPPGLFSPGSRDHEAALRFDRQLPVRFPPAAQLERSGTTAVVVLVTPDHILCANAGDSRAVLSRSGVTLPLSFDHKPNNDCEVVRVESDGGFVRAGRVDGDLAVSRSLGDFGYKRDGQRHGRNRVCSTPDLTVHTRRPGEDEFVLLACDGIWDRLTNRDASDLVHKLIHDEGETDVGLVCEEVIDTALELDSRDNMTCLLAVFPPAGMGTGPGALIQASPSSSSLVSVSGVLRRRGERSRAWGKDSTPAKRAMGRLEERKRRQREVLARAASQQQQGAQPGARATAHAASAPQAQSPGLSASGSSRGRPAKKAKGPAGASRSASRGRSRNRVAC